MRIQELRRVDLNLRELGGKGLYLRKYGRRLPLPRTFVLPASFVRDLLLRETCLEDLERLFSQQCVGKELAPEFACFQQQLYDLSPKLGSICELSDAIQNILPDAPRIILRSSVSVEDGELHSFAGKFASVVLPHRNQDQIWQAVKQIIVSVYDAARIADNLAYGIELRDVSCAVLLQAHINADYAGVAYSRHPNLLQSDQPRRHRPWGFYEYKPGSTDAVTGGHSEILAGSFADGQARPFAVQRLARMLRRLDAALGGPCDVEWCSVGGQLKVLQIRPVVGDWAQCIRDGNRPEKMTRELTEARFPDAMSPLGWSCLQPAFAASVKGLQNFLGLAVSQPNSLAVCIEGRVYADKSRLQLSPKRFDWAFWRRHFRIAWRRRQIYRGRLLNKLMVPVWEHLALRLVEAYHQSEERLQSDLRRLKRAINRPHAQSLYELMRFSIAIGERFLRTDFAIYVLKTAGERLIRKQFSDSEWPAILAYVSHHDNNPFVINKHSSEIRLSWDIARPGIAQQQDNQATVKYLPSRIPGSKQLITWQERFPLSLYRELLVADDRQHFFAAELLSHSRKLVITIEEELIRRGILSAPGDIFSLNLSEIRAAIAGEMNHVGFRVAMRQMRLQRYASLPAVAFANKVVGPLIGASPGRSRGKVCMLEDDLQSFVPGDIIYLTNPQPALASYFQRAGGVVCKNGGVLSHAMILAREFGVPAVCGLDAATLGLQRGAEVSIDGAKGEVIVH